MEKDFKPSGALDLVTRGKNRIKFFEPDKFNESFNKLINEIKSITFKLNMTSGK